jgi:hypothetical protein
VLELEPGLEPVLVVSVPWIDAAAVIAAVSDLAGQVAVVYFDSDSELASAAEAVDQVVVLAVGLVEEQVKTALGGFQWPKTDVEGLVEVVTLSAVPGFPTGCDYSIEIGRAAWQ